MSALTLDQVLGASRVDALLAAIVATLGARLPWCDVQVHPGKLDIADVVAKDMFRAPALAVAAVAQKRAVRQPAGTRHQPVDLAIYVVVEDRAHDGRRIGRDRLGRALCDALLDIVGDDELARWNLEGIGFPDNVEAKPLFAAKSFKEGAAFYAVTWTQEIVHRGAPLFDTDSPPPEFDWTVEIEETAP